MEEEESSETRKDGGKGANNKVKGKGRVKAAGRAEERNRNKSGEK